MKVKTVLAVVALGLAAMSTASAATSNLVTNGSFESPVTSSWNTYFNVPGWSTGFNGIEIQPTGTVSGVSAFDGKNYAELDTWANSSMWQNITTTAGSKYTLSFAYLPRPDTQSADSNKVLTFWNGSQVDMELGKNAKGWKTVTITGLTGREGTSELKFVAAGKSDSYGGFVDGVSVIAAVPEPETYAMMVAGLGLMGAIATRRRKAEAK